MYGVLLSGLVGLTAVFGVAFGATGRPHRFGPPAPVTAAPAAETQPNPDCTLTVPPHPLTARGLATPYVLSATDPAKGGCREANPDQAAFVQAAVIDPATGALSVYNPLVVDRGSRPAVRPVRPRLPRGAVVGIWFGFNGNTLTLRGRWHSLADGRCVNGTAGAPFGQFAYCNAQAFFSRVQAARKAGRLRVPPLGTAGDGEPCPTTRDFAVVDQDQSDNLTTDYLVTRSGRLAQRTARNLRLLHGATSLRNGSDNLLLDDFVDPALGCRPFTAPDLADPGHRVTALALNEIQAAAHQAAPVALVPLNDPMVTRDGRASRARADLYRAGVGQPAIGPAPDGQPDVYCSHLATEATRRLRHARDLLVPAKSPEDGQNLFDFLSARLDTSLTLLGCRAAAPTAAPTAQPPGDVAPSPTPAATDPAGSAVPGLPADSASPAASEAATVPADSPSPDSSAPAPSGPDPSAPDPSASDPSAPGASSAPGTLAPAVSAPPPSGSADPAS